MNSGIVEIQLVQFLTIYLLLILVGLIMKKSRVNQIRLLIVASLRMTVQLVLAGLILTAIFKNPHPAFTLLYVLMMIAFSIYRVLSRNKGLNRRFQQVIAVSIAFSGAFTLIYFIGVVVRVDLFNPQYTIPIAGMIMGNTMTGVSLGVKTFRESLQGQRPRIQALLCAGATPTTILLPFVRQAIETAMLPTLNSMIGMGIVSLPGMMTGQIISGTLPTTAILYQIAIIIALCAVVSMSSFGSLYFGYQTLFNKQDQIITL